MKKKSKLSSALVVIGALMVKSVLLAQNLTLNSDAAPNYKHLFGPHGGLLPH